MRTCKTVLAMAAVALIALAPVAVAEDGGGNKAAKPSKATGQLTTVAPDGIILTIKKGEGGSSTELKLRVDAKTEITINGQAGKLSDLRVGQTAAVTYDADNLALAITVGKASGGGEGGKKGG